jgi:hypothetical protein
MAKKEKKQKENKEKTVWISVPATAFMSEEEMLKRKRGEYEEKVAVDISFEDLINLTVTDVDKKEKK